MSKIELGSLKIDPIELGSQGNAILGIRDSGKSYTATYLAERLFEADIPFIAFDPIGIWRFLRVPGAHRGGKGYPVVVAGGKEGDLPLTETGAPEIVRAAMRNGVSLVIDLFDIKLSKSAWRRIVTQCVHVLLHENQQHGLRHVFIEEAAEFIPQKPSDWDVYNELEKLARMGGNSRLGYTLINQRSQEVAKAILELCENIFLHRQRGKNALENLDKWLSVAGAEEKKAIMASLPDLPQGECWAWIGGDKPRPPTLVKVPRKNSLHPDRRVMRGDIATKPKNAVDVGKFVAGMKSTLIKVEEEDKANNPVLLRKRIAELEAAAKKAESAKPVAAPAPGKDKIAEAEKRGFERGKNAVLAEARRIGRDAIVSALDEVRKLATPLVTSLDASIKVNKTAFPDPRERVQFVPAPTVTQSPPLKGYSTPRAVPPPKPRPPREANGHDAGADALTPMKQAILDALAWLEGIGQAEGSRMMVAFLADSSPKSSTFEKYVSQLRTAGLIVSPRANVYVLTDEGRALAYAGDAPLTHEAMMDKIGRKLTPGQFAIVTAAAKSYPDVISRSELAAASNFSETSSTFEKYLSQTKSLGLIEQPQPRVLRASERLFP